LAPIGKVSVEVFWPAGFGTSVTLLVGTLVDGALDSTTGVFAFVGVEFGVEVGAAIDACSDVDVGEITTDDDEAASSTRFSSIQK
jgi:hypothetical protein